MEWTPERRQLIAKLLAKGLLPAVIAAQIGISEAALRDAVRRYRLGEDWRGTQLFTTARGKKIRKVMKPRKPAKVTLARVDFADR